MRFGVKEKETKNEPTYLPCVVFTSNALDISTRTRKTELFIFLALMFMLLPLDLMHQARKVDLVQPQVMHVSVRFNMTFTHDVTSLFFFLRCDKVVYLFTMRSPLK